jgi:hypothetical protein
MALTVDTLLTTMRTVRALEPAPRLRIVFTTTALKDSSERLFCRRKDVPIGLIGGHISGLGCGDVQPSQIASNRCGASTLESITHIRHYRKLVIRANDLTEPAPLDGVA